MSRIRKDTETPAGGYEPEHEGERPTLPAYREMPDRSKTFQACEHVPVGQREPCAPCADKVSVLRKKFREYGERIEARAVKL